MTREWKRQIADAQDDRLLLYKGICYLRVPYTQETCWEWDTPPTSPCRDCGTLPGDLHVTICCMEQCPICNNAQRISCDAHWEDAPRSIHADTY